MKAKERRQWGGASRRGESESLQARKEIKNELDIKKDYKDYKFTVTFLVQDKKGR